MVLKLGGMTKDKLACGYQEPGWKDYLATFTSAKVTGNNQPSWDVFTDGIYAYSFSPSVKNEVWLVFHLNHDYALGTSIYPHIHWAPSDTNTGVVRWGIEFTVAKGHNQEAFGPSQTIYLEEEAPGIAKQHMVTEVADDSAISPIGLEPDTLIYMRVFRDAAHANDTYPSGVFGLMADLHYQSDCDVTLNKKPNFYA